jgi:hypothetical protein
MLRFCGAAPFCHYRDISPDRGITRAQGIGGWRLRRLPVLLYRICSILLRRKKQELLWLNYYRADQRVEDGTTLSKLFSLAKGSYHCGETVVTERFFFCAVKKAAASPK